MSGSGTSVEGSDVYDVRLERRLDSLRQLIREHAAAKYDRVRLEHYRKVKKAHLMKSAEQEGHNAIGAQEREAYAHPEYEATVNALATASSQETETWWRLQMEQWKFESWRTRMASERAEKSRYGAG